MKSSLKYIVVIIFILKFTQSEAQLFQDNFGTSFASISTIKWPSACRGGFASSFNTSSGACAGAGDYEYSLSFGDYITTKAIAIPASGYDLTFNYSFNSTSGFPSIEIRTGTSCGSFLGGTTTLTGTSGTCTPQTISLNAYAGQTIYIRFKTNSSSFTSFYFDDVTVDLAAGGGGGCLLSDNFGTAFASISATNWPSSCRSGGSSSFNTSLGGCAGAGDYDYGLGGFWDYITTKALTIPSTGYTLDFSYSFNSSWASVPTVEIRTGASCGTIVSSTTSLTNTSGVCTPQSISLNAYAGQTIYIRFISNTSSATFYFDDVNVCNTGGGGGSPDLKWADNFNDNNLTLNYAGVDGDEACTGCGTWTLGGSAALTLVPSSSWNGNSNKTEAFVSSMANVYYVKLNRNDYIESPIIDLSGQESVKISFYAKSSSLSTGGGDSWSSFSDHLKLQIWDGSAWITVKDITEGSFTQENKISSGLPFNYFCFTAYKSTTSPGNYYYNATPNVNAAYFTSNFKFRVIFEGGFSGAPFAWVDDFTFRADADGYSTMIPCGISYWNEPAATSYGQDLGTVGGNNAEKGVELELSNSISIPPLWASEANDGDTITQVFSTNQTAKVVFCVLSEQEINFAFPQVHYYSPSMGWQTATMQKDANYTGPGWKYYAIAYISCDFVGTFPQPTTNFKYYYSFEYGNEFIPVFYQLNTSGIEMGGGVTSSLEYFNVPDVTSGDNCGTVLPVTLLSFAAKLNDANETLLKWETVSEINNNYFELQRSVDGVEFKSFATVNGAGNSHNLVQYQYLDKKPLEGISYYRLKQVDFDGRYTYSDIVPIKKEREKELHVYPNPASNYLIIDDVNNKGGKIIDVTGKIIKTINPNTNTLDIKDIPKGIYFIQIKEDKKVIMKKFVKE